LRAAGGEEAMKAIVIGIMPQEKIRERVLAIACGEFKPKPREPKIWFTSMKSLAEVLSDENRALLKVIKEIKPQSISSLAEVTGRKPSNLSRTLKTMSRYGIIEMRREKNHVRPIVKTTEFRIVAT
jgi:predicted transcriptional regulator